MADTQIQNTEAPVITDKEEAVDVIENVDEVAAKLVASEESEESEKVVVSDSDASNDSSAAAEEAKGTEATDKTDVPSTGEKPGLKADDTETPSEEGKQESVSTPEVVVTDEGGTEVVDGETNKRKVEEDTEQPSEPEMKPIESTEPSEKKPKLDEESEEKTTETSN